MFVAFAAIVIAYLFYLQKQHQSKLEFLQKALERGQTLDTEMLKELTAPALFPVKPKKSRPLHQSLRVGGIITSAVGIGFSVFGYCLSFIDNKAFFALLGISALIVCVGIGQLVAGKSIAKAESQNRVA
jgi:hypothetical protein